MLEALFDRARIGHRAAFIPYVMAGDPDLETTGMILESLTAAGADAIELGIPYGDPLADGPTIAAAAQRALDRGVNMRDVFALVLAHKNKGGAPIILFTYYNPVYKYGHKEFARDASEAGASAVIVPDIALEEGEELAKTLATHGIDMPLLVAPSTNAKRAARIAEQSSGFIYVVSRLGVTGADAEMGTDHLRSQIGMLRGMTERPLSVGFGVSTPDHVRAVAQMADGVIVGSALIDAYKGARGEEATRRVTDFAAELIMATYYGVS
jgi:tryptophan synthase alpha chain